MTEAEAARRWCPERAKAVAVEIASLRMHRSAFESFNEMPGSRNCIGKGCMMWRWAKAPYPADDILKGSEGEGYCGLAGRP